MAIDKSRYTGKFADEGFENLSTVETLLFEIREGSSGGDDLVTLLRALHTLKGSARMLEFKRIEAIAHALESVFTALREERISLSDRAVALILAALDELKGGIAAVKRGGDDTGDTELFGKELEALAANEDFTVPERRGEKRFAPARGNSGPAAPDRGASGEARNAGPASSKAAPRPRPSPDAAAPTGREEARAESIRVSLDRIDGIIRSAAALQSLEIAARNIARDTETILDLGRRLFPQAAGELPRNSPLSALFRELEGQLGALRQGAKNYALDVGNHTRETYDRVISLRMLPLSTVLDGYPRQVFTIAAELGKRVRLEIEGAENEIDKNLIESLSEVFLHLIRNAIDHGIEGAEERKAAGKDETGRVAIRCVRESGSMKITVSDDGRGIDGERIREKIVEKGLLSKEGAAALEEEELVNYIFQSGFSTAQRVSDLSGRGVGMDAVKNNIEGMKGSMVVQSKKGEGTSFVISVPLSLASLMGFPVSAGGVKCIIPANFVDTILLLNREEIITVVDRPGIKYRDRIIKLYYLHQILRLPAERTKEDDSLFTVILRSYEETIALGVDGLSSMRQVILKNMPSFLETLEIFSGVVLSEDYEMVPALHVPTLIKTARRIKSIDLKKRHVDYERLRKSILVVDDSAPTRDIEKDILEAEGYRVDTASDGSEALAAAKNTRYDLICTDLFMPNMDGFMLTENIRKNESLKSIPVIVISSRSGEEDRAAALGVNRYMAKTSFSGGALVSAVRELIGEAHGQDGKYG